VRLKPVCGDADVAWGGDGDGESSGEEEGERGMSLEREGISRYVSLKLKFRFRLEG